MTCKTHPDAPHGFDRNASHSEDRYVCECESWEPPEQTKPMGVSCPRCGKTGLQPDAIHTCTPLALKLADWLDAHANGPVAVQHKAAAELRRLHAANAELLGTLKHARDLVAEWGACASAYEQERYGLALDLKQLNAAIKRGETT